MCTLCIRIYVPAPFLDLNMYICTPKLMCSNTRSTLHLNSMLLMHTLACIQLHDYDCVHLCVHELMHIIHRHMHYINILFIYLLVQLGKLHVLCTRVAHVFGQ